MCASYAEKCSVRNTHTGICACVAHAVMANHQHMLWWLATSTCCAVRCARSSSGSHHACYPHCTAYLQATVSVQDTALGSIVASQLSSPLA